MSLACSILSEDLLAICLLFAEGDLSLPLSEVMRRIEAYQEKHHSCFGESEKDLRRLFSIKGALIDEDRWKSTSTYADSDDLDKIFEGLYLRDFIMPVLEYHNAYFNDEGEWWEKDEERGPTAMNRKFREFFPRHTNPSTEEVKAFLHSLGYSDAPISSILRRAYDRYSDWAWGSPAVQRFIRQVVEPMEKMQRER